MIPQKEVTREMVFNHNSATNYLLETSIVFLMYYLIWNNYSKKSHCIPVLFHLHTTIL